mgnify:FL=1
MQWVYDRYCKLGVWVALLATLAGCAQGTGRSVTTADPELGLDRIGYVYVARVPDVLSEKTMIDVQLNGSGLGSISPDQFAVGKAHGILNHLRVSASGVAAEFYPSGTYRFSRAGRNNHYFLVDFEHRLTYDRLILRQVDRMYWVSAVAQ